MSGLGSAASTAASRRRPRSRRSTTTDEECDGLGRVGIWQGSRSANGPARMRIPGLNNPEPTEAWDHSTCARGRRAKSARATLVAWFSDRLLLSGPLSLRNGQRDAAACGASACGERQPLSRPFSGTRAEVTTRSSVRIGGSHLGDVQDGSPSAAHGAARAECYALSDLGE
jgi:hypothetical protein